MDPGDLEIDQKNGNPSDNRPCNLRACTRQQNTLNVKMRSDNTSGARGVSFDPSSIKNPWRAYIRSKRLGRFPSREAAMDALLKAVRCDQDLAFYYKEKTD
jgi:hypothetical protein